MEGTSPKVYFNSSDEDIKAVHELLKSNVDCDFRGSLSEERTPLLIHNSMRFYGLEGIKEFIELMEEQ